MQLRFTMSNTPKLRLPCLGGFYLEIRDGNNQTANALGVFCGEYRTDVERSASGRYMWLKFFPYNHYDFTAFYTGRSLNEKGMNLSSYTFVVIYKDN